MSILSIDGGKNVGYALFTDRGEEIERGVIQFDDWFVTGPYLASFTQELCFLRDGLSHGISQLVVEGFRHDPNVKQGGSLHEASQIVGSVKTYAAITGTPVTVQYAGQALPVAKQITGYIGDLTKTGNKKHLPDQDSAWLHGIYWLHCNDVDWKQWI